MSVLSIQEAILRDNITLARKKRDKASEANHDMEAGCSFSVSFLEGYSVYKTAAYILNRMS